MNRKEVRKRKEVWEQDEILFLDVTRMALDKLKTEHSDSLEPGQLQRIPQNQWESLVNRAEKHAVLALWYEQLEELELPEPVKRRLDTGTRQTVQQSYHLLYRTHEVTRALGESDVLVTVLKGVATASFYGIPEYRKSGDIDLLLLEAAKYKEAVLTLKAQGFFVKEEQFALHHTVFVNHEGIELELHTMLAEPFDHAPMNQYLATLLPEIQNHRVEKEIMGYTFPILSDGFHAYELLLHMLQHFLRSGFGVKLLCDWVLFWNRPIREEEIALYLRLVKESGLMGFSKIITEVCVRYLGLSQEHSGVRQLMSALCEDDQRKSGGKESEDSSSCCFMKEILEAEEFGKSQADRMVVLRGTGIFDYIREFHHQMHLSFPRSGRCFVCWPVLWCITLFRFLRNNRRIRGVSEGEIFRKAGERSRLMRQIHLFER